MKYSKNDSKFVDLLDKKGKVVIGLGNESSSDSSTIWLSETIPGRLSDIPRLSVTSRLSETFLDVLRVSDQRIEDVWDFWTEAML